MSQAMIDQFMEMVRIPSESGEEARFLDYLKEQFIKIGGKAEKDDYGNLIATFPAKGCTTTVPILMSCHGDTVQPGKDIEPVINGDIISSKGDTILGADDKAGIAELLEAIRTADVYPPLEIAISRQEEVGLFGVKNMDYSRITATKGFLLDNDTLDTIIIGGPSYFAIDVEITGKSAHAGMEPEKGINAIVAAAKAIAHLNLGRLDHESTANVGVIKGGLIRNGVPDKASFLAECRSLKHDKAQKIADEMEAIIIKEVEAVGAELTMKIDNLCKAVDIPNDSDTVKTAKAALKTVGIEAETTFMTGFTDASIYNNMGIEMAVVGIGAQNEHSTDECIAISDMKKAVGMIKEIFRLSAE
ncbi:M20/M25/M40 family metallo-hydrolase [bacterium]|nr:M20/M25/M40 family metallo-hydrolase [bacterium]